MLSNLRRRIAVWAYPILLRQIDQAEVDGIPCRSYLFNGFTDKDAQEFWQWRIARNNPPGVAAPEPQQNAFDVLRAANIARNPEWFPDGVAPVLPASFRGLELAGEVGEGVEAAMTHLAMLTASAGRICNILKKLERERLGLNGSHSTKEALAEECGDFIVCADLVGMDFDIDLWPAVVLKFNATSKKLGMKTMLPERFVGKMPELGMGYGSHSPNKHIAESLIKSVLQMDDYLQHGIVSFSDVEQRRMAFADARTRLHKLFPDINDWAIEKDCYCGGTDKMHNHGCPESEPSVYDKCSNPILAMVRDKLADARECHKLADQSQDMEAMKVYQYRMRAFEEVLDLLNPKEDNAWQQRIPLYTYDQLSEKLRPFANSGESLALNTPAGLVRGNLYVAVKNPGQGSGWRHQAIHASVDDLEKACGLKISTMPENTPAPRPKKIDYESFMPAFTSGMRDLADKDCSAKQVHQLFWHLYPKV